MQTDSAVRDIVDFFRGTPAWRILQHPSYPSAYQSVILCVRSSVCQSVCPSVRLSVHSSTPYSTLLPFRLSGWLLARLPASLHSCLSACLSRNPSHVTQCRSNYHATRRMQRASFAYHTHTHTHTHSLSLSLSLTHSRAHVRGPTWSICWVGGVPCVGCLLPLSGRAEFGVCRVWERTSISFNTAAGSVWPEGKTLTSPDF